MPRFARIVYPGGIYHIISRNHNREFMIAGKAERSYYLGRNIVKTTEHARE
jgi:REP element-mobilizing transposase RayT